MEPDSTQQSITSGIRFISPPHALQRRTILSAYCLCKSNSSTLSVENTSSKLTAFSFNSATEPIQTTLLHVPSSPPVEGEAKGGVTCFQNGNGVAQYRFREIFQSGAVSKIFKNRPSLR